MTNVLVCINNNDGVTQAPCQNGFSISIQNAHLLSIDSAVLFEPVKYENAFGYFGAGLGIVLFCFIVSYSIGCLLEMLKS